MPKYMVNAEYMAERRPAAAYDRRDKVIAKWAPIAQPEEEGYCGNFASHILSFDGKTVEFVKDAYGKKAREGIRSYQLMPSSLMLYRLACTFQPIVDFDGPDGYKYVWSAAFKHAKSKHSILIYEWKGGLTFGAVGPKGEVVPTSKAFIRDFLELFNYLLSGDCVHPYDGVVAGSVA